MLFLEITSASYDLRENALRDLSKLVTERIGNRPKLVKSVSVVQYEVNDMRNAHYASAIVIAPESFEE